MLRARQSLSECPKVPSDLQTILGDEYELVQNFPHPELEIDLIIGLRYLFKLLIE